ncbi:hypothetical protein SCB49_13805 [unidentified eubacterium SCB49]|nr:hypothetical protein SCB49_13805 [unidentified eubacterium SCB49]
MKIKKTIPLLALFIVCLSFTVKEIDSLKSLISYKLDKYAKDSFPEKIYIHTDKPYYTAGETIWFSSYLVNGITHTVSEKSYVIYVELINEKDSVFEQRKLFTEDLSVAGDIELPADLKEGDYLLRGYTNYMRNQGNEYFFKKNIKVYDSTIPEFEAQETLNNETTVLEEVKQNLISPDIGFYPEGGYLVNGISSRVAIKVEGQNKSSNSLKGFIVDNNNTKITDFSTFEFGLGSCYLKPELGKTYSAIITIDNKEIEYPLPSALLNGYVLKTSINKDHVNVEITTKNKEGLKDLLIIGHQRGTMAFDYIEKRNLKSTLVKIPKTELNEGVLEITLFNASKKPVAERLVFINKNQEAPIVTIQSDKTQISPREKVTLAIDVKDVTNQIIPSTMSVSITDTSTITLDENAENIKTWLLLNSDLKGKIMSPNYFFTENEEVKKQYLLDLTMMTHGWRRFKWQEFLEKEPLQKFDPETGIYIKGNTLSTIKPYLNKETTTKLTFKYEGMYQETKQTDHNGVFSYGPFVYNDSIDVIIQATETSFLDTTEKNLNTRINIKPSIDIPKIIREPKSETVFIKKDNITAYKKASLKTIESNYKFDNDREVLDEVFLEGKVKTKEEIKDEIRNKRTKHFKPTHRIVVDDERITGSPDMLSLLLNIPQLKIERGNIGGATDYNIHIAGGQPLLLLDNIPVDVQTILSLHKDTIDFIDVLRGSDAVRYPLEVYGVVAVFTKRGSRDHTILKNERFGTLQFKNPGFYSAKEFYAPDYKSKSFNHDRDDFRSTIHWEPKLLIGDKTSSEISFYSSDLKGPYIVEIEGITHQGVPFYKTAALFVE